MLVAMILCAALRLILACELGHRSRAALITVAGFIVGLLPLLLFNLSHDWNHLQQTVLFRTFATEGRGLNPLSLAHMTLSARFVLGGAWPLLVTGILVAAWRLAARRTGWGLIHLLLLHTVIYVGVYWLSGLRYLEVPPSRTLYALYPGLAILLGYAFHVPRPGPKAGRVLAAAALLLWIASVTVPTTKWVLSQMPREHGSWRGSWSLIDGSRLYKQLLEQRVQQAYANHWTTCALGFAIASAQNRDPASASMVVTNRIPDQPPPSGSRGAIILQSGASLLPHVEQALRQHNVPYQRIMWERFVILFNIDSSHIHSGIGLPSSIRGEDLLPPPEKPDGFN